MKGKLGLALLGIAAAAALVLVAFGSAPVATAATTEALTTIALTAAIGGNTAGAAPPPVVLHPPAAPVALPEVSGPASVQARVAAIEELTARIQVEVANESPAPRPAGAGMVDALSELTPAVEASDRASARDELTRTWTDAAKELETDVTRPFDGSLGD